MELIAQIVVLFHNYIQQAQNDQRLITLILVIGSGFVWHYTVILVLAIFYSQNHPEILWELWFTIFAEKPVLLQILRFLYLFKSSGSDV